ncbi:YciI family protein [Reinekea sp. G2M2-21]|uniref:YciI family protein n=1 Tax=Reinekea sp. G2M2-21 TaxID=2788942 RepID=UPI0018A972DB
MFIIDIEYTVSLDKIDPLIPEHVIFLNKYYDAGVFVMSGRKEPRSGGIIIAKANSRQAIEALIEEDSFYQANVANYRITEFLPGKAAAGLEDLCEPVQR